MLANQRQDKPLFLRVTASDLARLEKLTGRFGHSTRTGLAREAMRIGLDSIERDPSLLLARELPKRGGARKGAGRKPRKRTAG